MLDLESQLRQAEMGVELAGGVVPATRPAHKALSVEAMAMRDPGLWALTRERLTLERKLRVDRERLGEKHQAVVDAEKQLKLLSDEIDDSVATLNKAMEEGADILPVAPHKTREQFEAERAALQKQYARLKSETDELGRKSREIEPFRAEAETQKITLDETNKRIDQLITDARVGGRMTVENRGDRPLAPSKDKRMAFAAAGAFGLGGAGVGLVLLFGFLDRRIRHISDVKTTGQCNRVLGVLPMLPTEGSDPEQAMVAAHGVHQIRMLLQGHTHANKNTVIAVTSASPGAGKTSLTVALGLSFAASGARTLMIDCDMVGGGLSSKMKGTTRRRTGHVLRRLGLITSAQLVAAVRESRKRGERIGETLIRQGLVTPADVEHALQVQQESTVGLLEALTGDPANECITGAGTPGLFVMPLGSARRQHVAQLSLTALQRLVTQTRAWFDVVLIDTGPILGSLEASVAAMAADEVVLAVARGEQRPLIDRSIQHLNSVGGHLAESS
jgi:Mrp family chromosome partitioning ATPase